MLCLLLSQTEIVADILRRFCEGRGWSIVVYRLPLKALDNLEEISPEVVIINAVDFPRQWKVVAQHLNEESNSTIKKVLVVGDNFSPNDEKKAEFLNVDLVLRGKELGDVGKLRKLAFLGSLEKAGGLLKKAEKLFP